MTIQRRVSTLADPFKLILLIFVVTASMYFTGEVLKPLALPVLLSFASLIVLNLALRPGVARNFLAVP